MSTTKTPEPEYVYRHYKGGRYRLLTRARLSEDHATPLVVYVSLSHGEIWVRPLSEWDELVEWPDRSWRARYVLDQQPAEPDDPGLPPHEQAALDYLEDQAGPHCEQTAEAVAAACIRRLAALVDKIEARAALEAAVVAAATAWVNVQSTDCHEEFLALEDAVRALTAAEALKSE
jgi:hypothetical protein